MITNSMKNWIYFFSLLRELTGYLFVNFSAIVDFNAFEIFAINTALLTYILTERLKTT